MASTVHQFFAMQAINLREGRIDAIARSYSVPLVVSLPDVEPGYIVLSTRESIEHFFRLKHDGLKSAGVPSLRVAVRAARTTAADRLVASVMWYYLAPDGTRTKAISGRYFLGRNRSMLSVHMIEFEKIAFASLVTWFQRAGCPTAHPSSGQLH